MDFRHSDKYRKLGLNVAYYRKDRHFTQEGLAEVIDVDRSTIAKIEGALELPAYKLLEFRD